MAVDGGEIEFKLLYEIEIFGLINTVKDYTREHYPRNYVELLSSSSWELDKIKIYEICIRLLKWYEVNISVIEKNQFIHNLNEHQKSITFLKQIIDKLKECR